MSKSSDERQRCSGQVHGVVGLPVAETTNAANAERQAWRPVTREEAINQRDIWLREKVKAERQFEYWEAILDQM